MQVTQDEPGKRLVLEGRGELEFRPAGEAAVAIFAMLFVALLAFAIISLRSNALGVVVVGVPLAVGIFAAVRPSRAPSLVRIDREAGRVAVARAGLLGGPPRTRELALDSVARIVLAEIPNVTTIEREGWRVRPFDMRFEPTAGGGAPLAFRLDVRGVTTWDETERLAFAVARAAGMTAYAFVPSPPFTPPASRVELTRNLDGGGTPIPEPGPAEPVDRAARFPLQTPGPEPLGEDYEAAKELGGEVPPFDPSAFPIDEDRLERWEPGKIVRVFTPFSKLGFGLGLFPLACVGFFVFIDVMGAHGRGTAWRPNGLEELGLVVAVALLALAIRASLPHSTTIDWEAKEVRLRRGRRRWTRALGDLEAVEVRGKRTTINHKHGSPTSFYRGVVILHFRPGTTEQLIESDSFEEDAAAAYRATVPLGVELARSLGAPYRFTEFG